MFRVMLNLIIMKFIEGKQIWMQQPADTTDTLFV